MVMKIIFNINIPKITFPQINQVILIIIFAEFVIGAATAFIAPLLALFIVNDLKAPVTAVGIALAIFWAVKSIVQLPVARQLDKNHGEIDDYYSMLIGLGILMVAQYLYYFVGSVWQIYLLQLLLAVGHALYVPPFFGMFSRHLDKGKEAFEWSLWSSFSIGAGTALGSLLSGILAAVAGIRPIFLVSGTFNLIGLVILIFLRPYIKPKVPRDLSRFYPHTKIPGA